MSNASAPDEPAFEALLEYIRTNRGFGLDFPDEFEQLCTSIMRSHDGGSSSEVVVDATNRLGESVRCKVLCSPLHLNGVTQGAILLMEDA